MVNNLKQEGSDSVNYAGTLDGSLTNKSYHFEDHVGLPCGPVVKTLRFHCKGHRFDPWLGN